MKDWSELKRLALRAQPFNATDYAVTLLGSCATEVFDVIAENESLRKDADRYRKLRSHQRQINPKLMLCVDIDGEPCHSINFMHAALVDKAVDAISSPENPS